MSKPRAHVASLVLSVALLAARATATTYVVDSGGGGQFTDIPAAIAAAQPGDVLLVMQGVYSGFTLDKGLAIIGYGTVTIAGDANVSGVPAGQTASLVELAPNNLLVNSCAGPVVVQDLAVVQHIGVQQSTDVRVRHVDTLVADGSPIDGADVGGSRVELVRCSLHASNGAMCASGVDGGVGVKLAGSSRVQLALSNSIGGNGAYCFNEPGSQFQGGNGGAGVMLTASDIVYLTGGQASQINGGNGGPNLFYSDECDYDGLSAPGIQLGGGTLWYSGAMIVGAATYYGFHCLYFPPVPIGGVGQANAVMPDDPTLDVAGSPNAGGSVQFTLRARAGSTAILYFGRSALLIPDPNTQIEQLTQKSRIVHLGTIPASGQATFTWPIASSLQPGMLFVAQAEVTISPSDIRHTNSIPIVLR
jgi:hypothetical protein